MDDNPRPFQFRLRTLMIAVTLLCATCGYFAWQEKVAREREALRESVLESNRQFIVRVEAGGDLDILDEAGWSRHAKYSAIVLRDDAPDKPLAELKSAVPEAHVLRYAEYGRYRRGYPFLEAQ